jgi:hypothetical protein
MEKSAHEVQIENGPWVTFDIGIIEFFPHDQNLFRTVVIIHHSSFPLTLALGFLILVLHPSGRSSCR